MPEPGEIDPLAPEALACPHASFAALRARDPVHVLPEAGFALVSRADDVRRVAEDPATFSSRLVGVLVAGATGPTLLAMPAGGPRPADVLSVADPPAHGRQRAAAARALSPALLAGLEPLLRATAEALVSALPAEGEADLVEGLAAPLGVAALCALLGLPEGDSGRLRGWAEAGTALWSGQEPPSALGRCSMRLAELRGYLAATFEQAGASSGDGLVPSLVAETSGPEPALTVDEAVQILVQLVVLGHGATAAFLSAALHRLAADRDLAVRLRVEPDRIAPFLEEVLRLDAPTHGSFRVVTRPTTLRGVELEAGARLFLLWGSANRDERAFGQPDLMSLDRSSPRGHFSFGHGPHACMGAPLARLVGRVGVETLLARRSRFRLARPDEPLYPAPSLSVRALPALPVRFDRW